MRQSDFPRPCISGVRPQPSPSGPHRSRWEGNRGISRFSRMKSPHMHRFSDLAGSASDSRITPPAMLPSACHDDVGTPIHPISRLNSWPVRTPVQRFAAPSRVANAWLGATVDRYSFGVGLFHPHLHAGLSRRFPHVHRTIDRSGRHPALPRQHRRAYAADLRRGLPTDGQRRLRSQPPPQIPLRGRDGGCALHPGPYPPVSSRQSGYGASTTGSLTLYLLTLLDEPAPSGSAGTSRLCRGRLPPSPAFPGSGCPQLLPGRCDGPRETVSHHLSIYPAPRGALARHSK